MPKIITDFETWLLDYGDRLYRYLVYKRMFTPYEQQHAFEDESVYEDTHYELCQIAEAIDLGGDWLLGLRTIGEDGKVYNLCQRKGIQLKVPKDRDYCFLLREV